MIFRILIVDEILFLFCIKKTRDYDVSFDEEKKSDSLLTVFFLKVLFMRKALKRKLLSKKCLLYFGVCYPISEVSALWKRNPSFFKF